MSKQRSNKGNPEKWERSLDLAEERVACIASNRKSGVWDIILHADEAKPHSAGDLTGQRWTLEYGGSTLKTAE
ncbi:unnamed protein product [Nippostrongylus brasiliensis]|uniref:Transposase n=1 Tax=Nippostrongylus brasiliensis TaxID=27835 RepID=A0A0N4YXF4_NIPBR|nr:unnamed protein product [Nippostrongylus brasiliensis]